MTCCSALLRYPDKIYQRPHEFRLVELIFSLIIRENVPKSRFGNTVTEIWLACGLYNFLIGSTEFQLPKNMGTEPEIMFLGQLEGKM